MPLFPGEDGYRITKGASIATIVEAARRSGELVLTPAGAQQFGGHSLRTGGASMLARWGLNPFRIQSLGRWRSNLVIHYSGSAMSHGATEEARALLQPNRSSDPETIPPALQKLVKDVEAKLAKAEAKEAQHEAMLNAARQSKTASMAVIRNDDNAKVHRGIERSEAAACEWTITCGWRYSKSNCTRLSALPKVVVKDQICGRCFPFEKATLGLDLRQDVSESE